MNTDVPLLLLYAFMAVQGRFYFTLQCTEASVEELKIAHGY